MSSAWAAAFAVFMVFLIGLYVAGFVFWILKIVEVARIPDHVFKMAGSEKVAWILVVVLTQFIGALIWQFAKRDEVLAAMRWATPAPPGWYPEPGGAALRWWDGWQWTAYRHPVQPGASSAPVDDRR